MSVLFALAAPAAEQVCTTPAECANQGVDNFVGTPARIWASVAALVALVGVVIGGLALARSRRRIGNGGGKRGHAGPGGGADRGGPRLAGSGPLPPHRADQLTAANTSARSDLPEDRSAPRIPES